MFRHYVCMYVCSVCSVCMSTYFPYFAEKCRVRISTWLAAILTETFLLPFYSSQQCGVSVLKYVTASFHVFTVVF
jgi:hypothetical protein